MFSNGENVIREACFPDIFFHVHFRFFPVKNLKHNLVDDLESHTSLICIRRLVLKFPQTRIEFGVRLVLTPFFWFWRSHVFIV